MLIIAACSDDSWSPPEIPPGSRLKVDCSNHKYYEVTGFSIGVLCRSQADIERLTWLNDKVFDPDLKHPEDMDFRAILSDTFIFFNVNPYTWCTVSYIPAEAVELSNPLGYQPGGFADICSPTTQYDMAGRQIDPDRVTFRLASDYPLYTGNLEVPRYRHISDSVIEFY